MIRPLSRSIKKHLGSAREGTVVDVCHRLRGARLVLKRLSQEYLDLQKEIAAANEKREQFKKEHRAIFAQLAQMDKKENTLKKKLQKAI